MNQKKKPSEPEICSLYQKLKNLNISKKKNDINILVLGETGVGKSTFINSFFNYISFPTLAKARCEKLQVVIPSQFTMTDENYEERTIKVGKHHNESIEIGASATQACRSYLYPVQGTNLKIRLIDTPGVGDTRGIEQDNVNFENILTFIGELKHLNAICILLKPNNSRLTVMFEFCIKQLLSKLEKSASKNIIFVFTNTRSTFYRPGETLPPLKKLLETINGVKIPCEKSNIFCTDNESFRFLAALKNNVNFSKDDVENFSKSWSQSYDEFLRMILHIVGDENQMGLVPHDVKNTISVNEARRILVQLSQPLAEIAQLIQENIRAVAVHRTELTQANMSVAELKAKMFIPIVDLKVTKLDQPTTVCTSTKCSEVYQVGEKKKWHYRQKCHCPCYLQKVPKEIVGSPELINCAAMNNGECRKCLCKYQVHMHIYYETEAFQSKIEDEFVKTAIVSKEEAQLRAKNMSQKMSIRLHQLHNEKETIIKSTAKFACFLKTNAIVPYNDAYESYLQHLIDREKSLDEDSNFELIKQMEKMLQEYVEEKNTIMNAISQAPDDHTLLTAEEIISTIQNLYELNIYGSKIKELFEAQSRARKDENINQNKEYIFGWKQIPKNNDQQLFNKQSKDKPRSTQFRPNDSKSGSKYPPSHKSKPANFQFKGNTKADINVTICASHSTDHNCNCNSPNYPSNSSSRHTNNQPPAQYPVRPPQQPSSSHRQYPPHHHQSSEYYYQPPPYTSPSPSYTSEPPSYTPQPPSYTPQPPSYTPQPPSYHNQPPYDHQPPYHQPPHHQPPHHQPPHRQPPYHEPAHYPPPQHQPPRSQRPQYDHPSSRRGHVNNRGRMHDSNRTNRQPVTSQRSYHSEPETRSRVRKIQKPDRNRRHNLHVSSSSSDTDDYHSSVDRY